MAKQKCSCGGQCCGCHADDNHTGLLEVVEKYRAELLRAQERARSDQARLSIQLDIAEVDVALAQVKRGAGKPALACRQDGKIVSLPSGRVDTKEAKRANRYARYLMTADTGDFVSWFIGHKGMPYTPLVEAAVKIMRARDDGKKRLADTKAKFEQKELTNGKTVSSSRKGKGSADRKTRPKAGRGR